MEFNGEQKIIESLKQIIPLLENNDEKQWAGFLRNALFYFINSPDKKKGAGPIIKSMVGGMGSLSDVVLHKNGKPLISENDRLYNLTNELYDECKKLTNSVLLPI